MTMTHAEGMDGQITVSGPPSGEFLALTVSARERETYRRLRARSTVLAVPRGHLRRG